MKILKFLRAYNKRKHITDKLTFEIEIRKYKTIFLSY